MCWIFCKQNKLVLCIEGPHLIQNSVLRTHIKMSKGFFTLLCSDNDYIKGVLILNDSLKNVNSKYALHVIVGQDVSAKTCQFLEEAGLKCFASPLKKIKTIPLLADERAAKLSGSIAKLELWNVDFEKVVFLDAGKIFREFYVC